MDVLMSVEPWNNFPTKIVCSFSDFQRFWQYFWNYNIPWRSRLLCFTIRTCSLLRLIKYTHAECIPLLISENFTALVDSGYNLSLGYPRNFRFFHFLRMLPIFIIIVGKAVILPYYFHFFLTVVSTVCSQFYNTHSKNENTFVATHTRECTSEQHRMHNRKESSRFS